MGKIVAISIVVALGGYGGYHFFKEWSRENTGEKVILLLPLILWGIVLGLIYLAS
ncbi:MAG: hypothetical protein R3346_04525 [Candidatus Spechtbacterales bacterium]|nr:hypothetical protein [Candidatus Spechtbacterales bacterium]